jgi:hypothetical protein
MNARSLALAAVALVATSPLFADAPQRKPAEAQPAVREQSVLEELVAGMREIVRAVVPEIALPALEIKLPTLGADAR